MESIYLVRRTIKVNKDELLFINTYECVHETMWAPAACMALALSVSSALHLWCALCTVHSFYYFTNSLYSIFIFCNRFNEKLKKNEFMADWSDSGGGSSENDSNNNNKKQTEKKMD